MAAREGILETALRQLTTERDRINKDISEIKKLLGGTATTSGTAATTSSTAKTAFRSRAEVPASAKPVTTRKPMTAAQKRRISQTMKARWARIRAAAGKKVT